MSQGSELPRKRRRLHSGVTHVVAAGLVGLALGVGIGPWTEDRYQTCVWGIEAIDGDTFRCHGRAYRLASIDAPEIFKYRCKEELALGLRAKSRLGELLARDSEFPRLTGKDGGYGRWLSRHDAIAATLVAEGLAVPHVGKDPRTMDWCQRLGRR